MKHVLFFLLLAFGLGACDSGDPETDDLTVTGVVTNTFGQALIGGTVSVGSACTATTDEVGSFTCAVEAGTYTVTASVPGYAPQTAEITISVPGAITIPPLGGLGMIDAEVVNALTGDSLPDAVVECRRFLPDGSSSPVEFTATTTAEARLILSAVFLGEADCRVQIDGTWVPFQITITDDTTGTLAATPPPAEGTFRIVLSWGEAPNDLDSHITGPDGSGGRFHVYYSAQSFGDTVLDLDDTSSYGPETITLVPTGDGLYRYAIHNYTTQDGTGAQGIYASPATVRVYDASGLLRTYVAPEPSADNDGTDANTWCVFEMNISGSSITFEGDAPDGMGYLMASSSSDTTTFLTGGAPLGGDKPVAF